MVTREPFHGPFGRPRACRGLVAPVGVAQRLTPAGVTDCDSDGATAGKPLETLPPGSLARGQFPRHRRPRPLEAGAL